MSFALCTVPVAPVRAEPSHRSEMTNQLLFGEGVEVVSEGEEWRQVRSLYDGYEGWVTHHLIEPSGGPVETRYFVPELLHQLDFRGTPLHAPMGSALPGFDKETHKLWDDRSAYHGAFRDGREADASIILPLANRWLNVPYLWGGKTVLGVDCSGFVQTVFKVAGIPLLRDAWQQAEGGTIVSLAEACALDLAFFHNDKGRVTHVGLLTSPNEIIHASGRVRIDMLDEEGIINRETGVRTHRLHSVSRYVAYE